MIGHLCMMRLVVVLAVCVTPYVRSSETTIACNDPLGMPIVVNLASNTTYFLHNCTTQVIMSLSSGDAVQNIAVLALGGSVAPAIALTNPPDGTITDNISIDVRNIFVPSASCVSLGDVRGWQAYLLQIFSSSTPVTGIYVNIFNSSLCYVNGTTLPNSYFSGVNLVSIEGRQVVDCRVSLTGNTHIEYRNARGSVVHFSTTYRLRDVSLHIEDVTVLLTSSHWEFSMFHAVVGPPESAIDAHPMENVRFVSARCTLTILLDCSREGLDCFREPLPSTAGPTVDGDSAIAFFTFETTKSAFFFQNISVLSTSTNYVASIEPPPTSRVSFQLAVVQIASPERTAIHRANVTVTGGSVDLSHATEVASLIFSDTNGTISHSQFAAIDIRPYLQLVDHSITSTKTDRANCVIWLNGINVSESLVLVEDVSPTLLTISGEPPAVPSLWLNGSVTYIYTSLIHLREGSNASRVVVNRCVLFADSRNGTIPVYGAALPAIVMVMGSSVVSAVIFERAQTSANTAVFITNSTVCASVGFAIADPTFSAATLVVSIVTALFTGGTCFGCVIRVEDVSLVVEHLTFPITARQQAARTTNNLFVARNVTAVWVTFDIFALAAAAKIPDFLIDMIVVAAKRQRVLLGQFDTLVEMVNCTVRAPPEADMAGNFNRAPSAVALRDIAALVSLPPLCRGLSLVLDDVRSSPPASLPSLTNAYWFPVHAVSCAFGCDLRETNITVVRAQWLWSMFLTEVPSFLRSSTVLSFRDSMWRGLPMSRPIPYGATRYAVTMPSGTAAALTVEGSSRFVIWGNEIEDMNGLAEGSLNVANSESPPPVVVFDVAQCNAIKRVGASSYRGLRRDDLGPAVRKDDDFVRYPFGVLTTVRLPLFPPSSTSGGSSVVITCRGLAPPSTLTQSIPQGPPEPTIVPPAVISDGKDAGQRSTSVAVYASLITATLVSVVPAHGGGLAAMSLLQSAVGAAQLRRLCVEKRAEEAAAGAGASTNDVGEAHTDIGDETIPFSDPVDNPTQLSLLLSDDVSIDYAMGALVGNTVLVVGMGLVIDVASRARRRWSVDADAVEQKRTNKEVTAISRVRHVLHLRRALQRLFRLLPKGGLPASLIMPYAILVQPAIASAVYLAGHSLRTTVSVVMAVVSLALWLGPLAQCYRTIVVPPASDFPLRTRPSDAIRPHQPDTRLHRRRSASIARRGRCWTRILESVATVQRSTASWMATLAHRARGWLWASEEWVPRDPSRRSVRRESRRGGGPGREWETFAENYGPLFEAFRFQRRWFGVSVEMTAAGLSGVVQGAALSVATSVDASADIVCSAADWGGGTLVALVGLLLVSYVALRPFCSQVDNGAAVALALLAILAEICSVVGADAASSGLVSTAACIAVLLPLLLVLVDYGLCGDVRERCVDQLKVLEKRRKEEETVVAARKPRVRVRLHKRRSLQEQQQVVVVAPRRDQEQQRQQRQQLTILLQMICDAAASMHQ